MAGFLFLLFLFFFFFFVCSLRPAIHSFFVRRRRFVMSDSEHANEKKQSKSAHNDTQGRRGEAQTNAAAAAVQCGWRRLTPLLSDCAGRTAPPPPSGR